MRQSSRPRCKVYRCCSLGNDHICLFALVLSLPSPTRAALPHSSPIRPRIAPFGLASSYRPRRQPPPALAARTSRLNWTQDWAAASDWTLTTVHFLDFSLLAPCFPSALDLGLPLLHLLDLGLTFRLPLYPPRPRGPVAGRSDLSRSPFSDPLSLYSRPV